MSVETAQIISGKLVLYVKFLRGVFRIWMSAFRGSLLQ